ncbi:acyltransferase [Microbispora sp. RL4-1S]|uniref:Acyltransferase n=1 Tax=Microbispora oryzae TaxID=2806554 RepID=A0A940WPV5_9ACTN|nr:acyltransferase [Microbispora oryzae]
MWRGVRRLAERTPPSRERFVDLLRAVSIVAVVLGHWLASVVGYDRRGELFARSALPDLPWAQPLTWVVQVMPVFFFVGGYANAVSLDSERRRGGNATAWLINRGGRLIRPTTALVVVMAGGALAARLLGADPSRIRLVVWFSTIPLWFLVVYVLVVVLTPPMYALHRRYGLVVPAVLAALVGAGDLGRLLGEDWWGYGNFLFGWLAVHQMGFAWRDGRLPARPRVAIPLIVTGFGALALLTLVGPYPISMINVPGERLHNMSPPSLALLAVATTQLGAALLVRDRADRWLRRRRPWTVVVALNSVILTIFLWHITAAALLVGALHVAGALPTPEVGTPAWLAWRIPFLIMFGAVLIPLVAVFGPIEIRGAGRPAIRSGPTRLAFALAAFAGIAFGLFDNSLLPSTAPVPFGLPTAGLIAYLSGAAILRFLRRVRPPPRVTEPRDGAA